MPINTPPYNPLDKLNLAKSIRDAIHTMPRHALADLKKCIGSGIYALYYIGDFKLYKPIAAFNKINSIGIPLYVGKAEPSGLRTGHNIVAEPKEPALYNRVSNHRRSISATQLDVNDFQYRWLSIDSVWIPLGEALMISELKPIWNSPIDGFGNNAPGGGRGNQVRSNWDTLHPGRSHSQNLNDQSPEHMEKIISQVEVYMRNLPQIIKSIPSD